MDTTHTHVITVHPDEARPGDRMTITFTIPDDGTTIQRFEAHPVGPRITLPGVYEVKVERTVPKLPTGSGAIVHPTTGAFGSLYVLDFGPWRTGDGNPVAHAEVAAALEAGTHYVAFEGVHE